MYVYACACVMEGVNEVQKTVQNALKLELQRFLSLFLCVKSVLSPSARTLLCLLTIYLSGFMNFDFNNVSYHQEIYLIPLKTTCVQRLKSHSFKL